MSLLLGLDDLTDQSILAAARVRAGVLPPSELRFDGEREGGINSSQLNTSGVALRQEVSHAPHMDLHEFSLTDIAFGDDSVEPKLPSRAQSRTEVTQADPDLRYYQPESKSRDSTPGTPRSIRRMSIEEQILDQPHTKPPDVQKQGHHVSNNATLGDVLGSAGAIRVMLSPGARGRTSEWQDIKTFQGQIYYSSDRAEGIIGAGATQTSGGATPTGASLRSIVQAMPVERGTKRLMLIRNMRQLLRGKLADAQTFAEALAPQKDLGQYASVPSIAGTQNTNNLKQSAGARVVFSPEAVLRPWVERHVCPVLCMLLQDELRPDPVSPTPPSLDASRRSSDAFSPGTDSSMATQAVALAWESQRAEWQSIASLAALVLLVKANVSTGSQGLRGACLDCIRDCMDAGAPTVHPQEVLGGNLERLSWPPVAKAFPQAQASGAHASGSSSATGVGALQGASRSVVVPEAVPLLCALALSEPGSEPTVVDASLAEASGLLSPVKGRIPTGASAADGVEAPMTPAAAAQVLMEMGRGCTDAVSHACVASVLHSSVGACSLVAPIMCATLSEAAGVRLESGFVAMQEAGRSGIGTMHPSWNRVAQQALESTSAMLRARAVPPKSASGQVSGVVAAIAGAQQICMSSRSRSNSGMETASIVALSTSSLLMKPVPAVRQGSVADLDARIARHAAACVLSNQTPLQGIKDSLVGHVCASSGSSEPLRSIISAAAKHVPIRVDKGPISQDTAVDAIGNELSKIPCVFHALSPQQCADLGEAVAALDHQSQQNRGTLSATGRASSKPTGRTAQVKPVQLPGRPSVGSVLGLRSMQQHMRTGVFMEGHGDQSENEQNSIWIEDDFSGAIAATGGLDAGAASSQFFVEVLEKLQRSRSAVLVSAVKSGRNRPTAGRAFLPGDADTRSASGSRDELSPGGIAASMSRTGFVGTLAQSRATSLGQPVMNDLAVQAVLEAVSHGHVEGGTRASPIHEASALGASRFAGRTASLESSPGAGKISATASTRSGMVPIMYRRRFLSVSRFVLRKLTDHRSSKRGLERAGESWTQVAEPRLHVILSSTHVAAASRVAAWGRRHWEDGKDTLTLHRTLDLDTTTTGIQACVALLIQHAYSNDADAAKSLLDAVSSCGCSGIWKLCGGVDDQGNAGVVLAQQHLLLHARSLQLVDERAVLCGAKATNLAITGRREDAALGSSARQTWIADADTPELLSPGKWSAGASIGSTSGTDAFKRWVQRTDELLLRVSEWGSTADGEAPRDLGALSWSQGSQSQLQILVTARVASLALAAVEICHNQTRADVIASALRLLGAIGPAAMFLVQEAAETIGAALAPNGSLAFSAGRQLRGGLEGSAVVCRVAAVSACMAWSQVIQHGLPGLGGTGLDHSLVVDIESKLERTWLHPLASTFLHSRAPLNDCAATIACIGRSGLEFLCNLTSGIVGISSFDDWSTVKFGLGRAEALRLASPSHAKAGLHGLSAAGKLFMEASTSARRIEDLSKVAGMLWHLIQARSAHSDLAEHARSRASAGVSIRTMCEAIRGITQLWEIQNGAGHCYTEQLQWLSSTDVLQLLGSLMLDTSTAVGHTAAESLAAMGSEGRLVLTELFLEGVQRMRQEQQPDKQLSVFSATRSTHGSVTARRGLSSAQLACVVEALGKCGGDAARTLLLATQLSAACILRKRSFARSSRASSLSTATLSTSLKRGTARPTPNGSLQFGAEFEVLRAACLGIVSSGATGLLEGILGGSAAERGRDFRRAQTSVDHVSKVLDDLRRSDRGSSKHFDGASPHRDHIALLSRAVRQLIGLCRVADRFGASLCSGEIPLHDSVIGASAAVGLSYDVRSDFSSAVGVRESLADAQSVLGGSTATTGSRFGATGTQHVSQSGRRQDLRATERSPVTEIHPKRPYRHNYPAPLSIDSAIRSEQSLPSSSAPESMGAIRVERPSMTTIGLEYRQDRPGLPGIGHGDTADVLGIEGDAPGEFPVASRAEAVEMDDALLGDALRLSHLIMG